MAEESDQLSRWVRLSCYEVPEDVSRPLQACVVKARPDPQDIASFSRRIVSEPTWQRHCAMPELLLLSDVVATVSHLVRFGRPLYDSFEELAQVSHLLARWHMPDHLQTRRGSATWLQWTAVRSGASLLADTTVGHATQEWSPPTGECQERGQVLPPPGSACSEPGE